LVKLFAGTLKDYEFGITCFADISAGLDNVGIPKLSSNKLNLLFISYT
jgi:hypothetical protein